MENQLKEKKQKLDYDIFKPVGKVFFHKDLKEKMHF